MYVHDATNLPMVLVNNALSLFSRGSPSSVVPLSLTLSAAIDGALNLLFNDFVPLR